MIVVSTPVTLCTPGPVYHLTHQLATGRVNVIAPGRSHCHHKTGIGQHLPKPTDGITTGSLITRIGEIVKGDEVDLAGIVLQQRGELSRLLGELRVLAAAKPSAASSSSSPTKASSKKDRGSAWAP